MAWRMSRPPRVSSSSGLVELARVRVVGVEHRPEQRLGAEAGLLGAEGGPGQHAVARCPAMVLISPLWHSMRKGWARSQVGSVLVEKRWWKMVKAASKPVVGEVEVEVGQVVGGGQALVDDGPERAGRDVEAVDVGQVAAEPVGRDLVAVGAVRRRGDDGLEDLGPGLGRHVAEDGVVGLGLAPVDHLDALGGTGVLDQGRGVGPPHEEGDDPVARPRTGPAGMGVRMPQPSEVSPSAAAAPRCLTQARPCSAAATMAREARPCASATKPMPHASNSRIEGTPPVEPESAPGRESRR